MIAVILCLLTMSASAANKDGERFFDRRVAPILIKRCLACHNEELKNGGVSFLDRESLLRRGRNGAPVVPGDPAASVLILVLSHRGDVKMPPGVPLSSKDIATLTEWVRRGALWGRKLRSTRA